MSTGKRLCNEPKMQMRWTAAMWKNYTVHQVMFFVVAIGTLFESVTARTWNLPHIFGPRNEIHNTKPVFRDY